MPNGTNVRGQEYSLHRNSTSEELTNRANKAWETRRLKKKSKIKLVGIEIEGAWDRPIDRRIHGDCSVCDFEDDEDEGSCYTLGEVISTPSQPNRILDFIEKYYPDLQNYSCGIHIHLSFYDRISYIRLMKREFYDYFLEQMEIWANENHIVKSSQFWNRFRGENRFAKKEFRPEAQSLLRYKDPIRYTHLNYCYTLHKTIEVRMLPTFKDKRIAKKALVQVVKIFNDYLMKKSKVISKPREIVVNHHEEIEETEIICV